MKGKNFGVIIIKFSKTKSSCSRGNSRSNWKIINITDIKRWMWRRIKRQQQQQKQLHGPTQLKCTNEVIKWKIPNILFEKIRCGKCYEVATGNKHDQMVFRKTFASVHLDFITTTLAYGKRSCCWCSQRRRHTGNIRQTFNNKKQQRKKLTFSFPWLVVLFWIKFEIDFIAGARNALFDIIPFVPGECVETREI